jgi:hypothetical protein
MYAVFRETNYAPEQPIDESPVQQLLDPLMSAPSKLLGTGPVVVNDLAQVQRDSR